MFRFYRSEELVYKLLVLIPIHLYVHRVFKLEFMESSGFPQGLRQLRDVRSGLALSALQLGRSAYDSD